MKQTSLFILLLFSMCMQAAIPRVELKDTEGNSVYTDGIIGNGRPVVISFFATWCKPCIRELHAIHDLYNDWEESTGVEIYIVSIDQGQDIKKVKPMVDGYGWEYQVLLDPNSTFKRALNVQNVPHMFIFDGQGKTLYNHVGYTDGDETEIEKILYKSAR